MHSRKGFHQLVRAVRSYSEGLSCKSRAIHSEPSVGSGAPSAATSPTETSLISPLDSLSPRVLNCEYAVRGPIVARAEAIEQELKKRPGLHPFNEIVYCNIGNPQALGQRPVTFFREVVALIDHPDLLKHPNASSLFSTTAIERARHVLGGLSGQSTGSYTTSQGAMVCREAVAQGIERRDGHAASPNDVFLTDGASSGVHMMMQLLLRSPSDGLLCPIPQYPLYSAALTLHGGSLVPYFLEESKGWALEVDELERAVRSARTQGISVRGLCVINPGNPTGQVLQEENQRAVVRFCCEHGLVLLADEVYQENVYAPDRYFTSFKKVARDMGVTGLDLCLISFHSVSKGFYGECGRRGGYMEVIGMPPAAQEQLAKVASVDLCSNVAGQVLMSLVMNPPQEGEAAHELFVQERSAILTSLARRAKVVVDGMNALEGVQCNAAEGAMYAFPRLHLPHRAVMAAQEAGVAADALYVRQLLEETGIVLVPGSGFGQVQGTWHVRCTILPPEERLAAMLDRLSSFHEKFMKRFSD